MSWQLESWLREIVYVELHSTQTSPMGTLGHHAEAKPPTALTNDKRQHHMATPHEESRSYLSFSQLWRFISADENWSLFSEYFPPRSNVEARIEEVRTIRNRVAHCRAPHENDERRLELFLRDLEPGLRRFCARYSRPAHKNIEDAVAAELVASWGRYGYATELFSTDRDWLYAPEPHTRQPRLGGRLTRLCRWSESAGGEAGTVYSLELFGLGGLRLKAAELLDGAVAKRDTLLHVIVQDAETVRITIPGIVGVDRVVETAAHFLRLARNALSQQDVDLSWICRQAWPEYVLLPSHPFAWFTEESQGPLLDLS